MMISEINMARVIPQNHLLSRLVKYSILNYRWGWLNYSTHMRLQNYTPYAGSVLGCVNEIIHTSLYASPFQENELNIDKSVAWSTAYSRPTN